MNFVEQDPCLDLMFPRVFSNLNDSVIPHLCELVNLEQAAAHPKSWVTKSHASSPPALRPCFLGALFGGFFFFTLSLPNPWVRRLKGALPFGSRVVQPFEVARL